MNNRESPLRSIGDISRIIFEIRGQRVILDRGLARLYGVSTARLNEAVSRNLARFPEDFLLRLTPEENRSLISQNATSKVGRGGNRKIPRAFTEHGAIQAANILNSSRAVEMGVHVVRAFLRLRELIATNHELSEKLDEPERRYKHHDSVIVSILGSIRRLMNPEARKSRGIGFTADLE